MRSGERKTGRRGAAMRIAPGLLAIAVGGCAIGDTMHVTRGIAPAHVDSQVRFRTTYFFRTFDYCWNLSAAASHGAAAQATAFHEVIPETDVIYRYRMTGKASSLFNQVRFESGTLSRSQIDPFGAGIAYDTQARGFRVGGTTAPSEAVAKLQEQVAALHGRIAAAGAGDAAAVKRIAALEAEVASLRGLTPDERCHVIGGAVRRGFQIMGPEGIRTFDQDERLVMAMSSSAKPLIETLQEYSGRILSEKAGAAVLLPLARENLRIVEASRAVERTAVPDAVGTKRTATDVFDAAIAAFGEK